MPDLFDRAQESDAKFRHQALEHQTRSRGTGATRDFCSDCEEPIPTARQEAIPGCQRCIRCAEEFEKEGGR